MTTNVLLRIFNIINFFFSRCRLYPFSLDLIPCSLSIVKLAKGGVLSLLQILVLCYIKSWTHISHTLKPSFFHSGINAEKRRPSTDITSTLRQKHQIERFSKSTDTLVDEYFFLLLPVFIIRLNSAKSHKNQKYSIFADLLLDFKQTSCSDI